MEVEIYNTPSLQLTRAILVYTSNVGTAVATEHNVVGGRIQPGSSLDLPSFIQLIQNPETGRRTSAFTPACETLICESPEFRVWFKDAGNVTTYLNGSPRLIWHPRLVFCGHRHLPILYVWAAKTPTHEWDSQVMHRYMLGHHLNEQGRMCLGSANPKGCTPAEWEDAFFMSSKTTDEGFTTKPYAISTLKKIGPLKTCLTMVARK